jgi:hypothetical protein
MTNRIYLPLRSAVLILLLVFGLRPSAFSWGVTGHRVIAAIAQNHLSPKALLELHKLIGKENLAMWANWPDFIKSDTTHTWDNTFKWHYVDLPGKLEKDEFIKELKALSGENLYTQIPAMMAQLKDKSLPKEKRVIALRFLIHLVGDLHQPLHVGRPDDQGGNKITEYWFDKKTNLHSIWDSELINFQQYSYTEYAAVLDIAGPEKVASIQKTSLEDWFYESHQLADKIYDLSPAESRLSYKYDYIFQPDVDSQLLKGGLRLAKLLNEALN